MTSVSSFHISQVLLVFASDLFDFLPHYRSSPNYQFLSSCLSFFFVLFFVSCIYASFLPRWFQQVHSWFQLLRFSLTREAKNAMFPSFHSSKYAARPQKVGIASLGQPANELSDPLQHHMHVHFLDHYHNPDVMDVRTHVVLDNMKSHLCPNTQYSTDELPCTLIGLLPACVYIMDIQVRNRASPE